MNLSFALITLLAGCPSSKVDDDGSYSRLFPKTPLSEAPCLEDQDCIVTHLKDGSCCPDPVLGASNLYTRDQFAKLLVHQSEICPASESSYTCPPPPPPPGHIDTVNKGQCVNQKCVLIKVPSDAPGTPTPPIPPDISSSPDQTESAPEDATPTIASPTE